MNETNSDMLLRFSGMIYNVVDSINSHRSRMLVVSTLLPLLFWTSSSEITTEEHLPHKNLTTCVNDIIKKYINDDRTTTYINVDDDKDHLLQELHAMEISVTTRKLPHLSTKLNRAYFIAAKNDIVLSKAVSIKEEKYWSPNLRFIVVIKQLDVSNVRLVFDTLLSLEIHNVIVINGTETAELYSYDAFENNACGNYYTRIIEHGRCNLCKSNLYPNKVQNLRNCFFRVSVLHYPPITINPEANNKATNGLGTEQYIIQLLSEVEHFNYNFSYDFDPEDFSLVSSNMSVRGPLAMLLNNETDIFIGGMFLLAPRTIKFSYIHGHLDGLDEVRVLVKKATTKPPWTNYYLGFSSGLWFILFMFLIIYSLFLILFLKSKDKCNVFMVLLANLVQHGTKLTPRGTEKTFLIIWVWFAYLIYCFYASSLVSLNAKPSVNFQISNDDELRDNRLEPCFSPLIKGYNYGEELIAEGLLATIKESNNCKTILESMSKVSQSDRLFTVVPYILYTYNKDDFKNKYGEPLLYVFDKPESIVNYAIYVHKGFALLNRLSTWVLRFRESGLIKKSLEDIMFLQKIQHRHRFKVFKSGFAVPWFVYGIGLMTSFIIFLIEISYRYIDSRIILGYINVIRWSR